MKRLLLLSLAAVQFAGFRACGEDSLKSILERPYIPPGYPAAQARIASPTAHTAAHLVTETELLDRVSKELADHFNPDGELRLTFGRPLQPFRVPSEDWEVTLPEMPIGGLSKSFLIRIRISAADRVWLDQQFVVQAQLWKPVLVATRRLERGQSLDATAAELQTLDVLRERISPVSATTKLEEQEVVQTVMEGRPISCKDIAPAPMVRKGAVVEVVAGDGNMSITMKGVAMGTGGAGDAITVRNIDTRKDFQARVVNRNSVHVSF